MQERVTVSIGVSGFPHEATIASQLIRVADYRLYQAKEAGRNQVVG
jgi:diguanylate cyclase (GGDEF)-like protein